MFINKAGCNNVTSVLYINTDAIPESQMSRLGNKHNIWKSGKYDCINVSVH